MYYIVQINRIGGMKVSVLGWDTIDCGLNQRQLG